MSVEATDVATRWRHLPCNLDAGPSPLAGIGLITLATDQATEPEAHAFLPDDPAVGVYVTRIPMSPVATPESLAALERGITQCMELLLPGVALDAVAFSCTSGGIAVGPERVEQLIRAVKPEAAVTMPVTAAAKALRRLGARRLAVVTPYVDSVNAMIDEWFAAAGFELVVTGSFKQPGDAQMNRIDPQSIYEAGVALAKGQPVDALFVSCTGLRVSPVLEALEKELGMPVVTSNQAQAWDCLRMAGYDTPLPGRGRLFQLSGARSAA